MTTFPLPAFDPACDLELIIETDCTPHDLYRGWTDPTLITKWFTPAPYVTEEAETDLYPGGQFRTVMSFPDGDKVDETGCFLYLDEPNLIIWSAALGPGFRPRESEIQFTAILTFTQTDAGNTIYRAHLVHPDPESKERHETMGFHDGWTAAFRQLEVLLQPPALTTTRQ